MKGDMGDSTEKKARRGILNAVFGRKNIWPRRSTSTGSLRMSNTNNTNKDPPYTRRRKGGSDDGVLFETPISDSSNPYQKQADRIIERPGPNHPKVPPTNHKNNRNDSPVAKSVSAQGYGQGRRAPSPTTGLSGELDSLISDHQKSKGANGFVRASSGNVMLDGHLGNLRQGGGGGGGIMNSPDVLNHLPKEPSASNGRYPNSVPGTGKQQHASLCRAVSTRMDPEQLKIMGNEDYKMGRFAEALALYDTAIFIDPNKASYRSNKSAALTALGRLLEAVFECREAVRIEPQYQRAHNRLATLYIRLGEAEKAMYHFKHAGIESDPDVLTKAKNLQVHLSKCTEAKRQRDWNALLRETERTVLTGADSAPQIFSLQAEALLRLHRFERADEAMRRGPSFEVDDCTKFFGPVSNAQILLVRAQVDLAAGRFDEAVSAAQRATKLDPSNKEASVVARRTRSVAMTRSNGNDFFREQRYSEACVAYGEGLNHDPYNAVLLCNRATCRFKLGQFEKAAEDCSAALNLRPSYRKARLRRAECYAKLEKWEGCVHDYEVIMRETPDDEEVVRALKDARSQLKEATRP